MSEIDLSEAAALSRKAPANLRLEIHGRALEITHGGSLTLRPPFASRLALRRQDSKRPLMACGAALQAGRDIPEYDLTSI